jgi:hypothetical protein
METTWDDDVVWDIYEIESDFLTSYAHPNIDVNQGHGYIACETNENGNTDIVCFHTTDGFATTQKTFIANSADEETDPSIVSYGDTAQCTFIKNGNLYVTFSSDGGSTWNEPAQVNDADGTVVPGWHAVELTIGGNVIWTADSNDNADIYYDNVGSPAPVLGIQGISGGFGITATVTNTGGVDAEDVGWTIAFDGPVFIGSEKTGTVTVPVGDEVEIKSGLVFGIGRAAITVTVGGSSATANGLILGPLVLGLS